jgi:GNAT superfamily N-acetyltransferase
VNFVPLAPGSAARALPLMESLYRREHIHHEPARTLRSAEWLLEHPEWGGIWIVTDEGRDAGYFAITVGSSIEFQGRFAILDELYIAGEWRGRGIGPAVVAFVVEWAREQGFAAVRLEVGDENFHGQHVYAKAGFRIHPDRRLMTKWLA